MTKTIAIIGAGKMGQCLLGGLIGTDYPPEKLWVTEPNMESLDLIQEKFAKNIHITTQNSDAVDHADIILLAVKPNILPQVLKELASSIQQKKPMIISVAAAITVEMMEQYLGKDIGIVRAMPNTPALIQCGITALFANKNIDANQRMEVEAILNSVGTTVWIEDEKQMDIVTALSGSGPAYFFLMMEALQDAGEKLGLTKDIAKQLVLHTAYGSALMTLETGQDVVALRKQVTSPGGTTEQAIKVLEESHIRDIFNRAITAGFNRSHEIIDSLSKKMES